MTTKQFRRETEIEKRVFSTNINDMDGSPHMIFDVLLPETKKADLQAYYFSVFHTGIKFLLSAKGDSSRFRVLFILSSTLM